MGESNSPYMFESVHTTDQTGIEVFQPVLRVEGEGAAGVARVRALGLALQKVEDVGHILGRVLLAQSAKMSVRESSELSLRSCIHGCALIKPKALKMSSEGDSEKEKAREIERERNRGTERQRRRQTDTRTGTGRENSL